MNASTLTTKTGLAAIGTILATALGIYTGTLPLAAGLQTIVTAVLSLFIRDGITTNTAELAKLSEAAEAQAQADARKRDAQKPRFVNYDRSRQQRDDVAGA